MDNSAEQYQQHYQQPAPPPPQTAVAEAGYDIPQSSDQLAAYQAYYAYPVQQPYDYHHHLHHHSQYPSQDYPYNYHQEYVPVHPPGVPVPSTQDHAYYAQGDLENHLQLNNTSDHPAVMVDSSMHFASNLDVVQPAMQPQVGHFTRGGGRRGGRRPFRGRGRGHFANRGPPLPNLATSEVSGAIVPPGQVLASTSSKRPSISRMVRCEVCKVDCNTNEILEQHLNGKKHKKNVLAQERLQNLNKPVPVPEANLTVVKPQAANPEKDGHSGGGEDSNIQHEQKNTDEELKTQVDLQVEEQPQGRGSKRKSKGGRGGKFAKTNEGRRRQAEPPKPKEVMVPFICELCHVTCESKMVLDSHLAGKKHSVNLKRFHGHRALYGDPGLQTFYPPPHITEPQSSSFISQVQQQGVTDPQALLAQLVTFLLSQAQTQSPGLMASQIAGLAAITQAPGLVAPAMPPAPQFAESQFYQNSQQLVPHSTTENANTTNVVVESVTADYRLSKTATASDSIEGTVQPGIEQDPSIPVQE